MPNSFNYQYKMDGYDVNKVNMQHLQRKFAIISRVFSNACAIESVKEGDRQG